MFDGPSRRTAVIERVTWGVGQPGAARHLATQRGSYFVVVRVGTIVNRIDQKLYREKLQWRGSFVPCHVLIQEVTGGRLDARIYFFHPGWCAGFEIFDAVIAARIKIRANYAEAGPAAALWFYSTLVA